MAEVKLEQMCKSYDGKNRVVDKVNLTIKDKEFMVVVGPSGCGKSTTLRMIAGLEEITSGKLYIDDKQVNNIPPKDRDIAMVFQNYALYPHMNVYDNIAFGLKLRKFSKIEIEKRVKEASAILELEDLLQRKPKQLSGGQKQRVALGRAIVRQPKVFLFDEPLSNLDAKLRVQMRKEIKKLHRKLNATMIYVTHDQTEAMTMGDRIAVMDKGILQQVDTPLNLYDNPANKFVAGFIGSPPMNFIEGKITVTDKQVFESIDGSIKIPVTDIIDKGDSPVYLGIRPEHVDCNRDSQFLATVENYEIMGNETLLYLNTGKSSIISRTVDRLDNKIGDEMNYSINPDKIKIYNKE